MFTITGLLFLLNLLAPCLLVAASPVGSASLGRGVKMPVKRRSSIPLSKRQSIDVSLSNDVMRYLVETTIGGQTVELDLDTGSSDVWALAPGACDSCSTGTYDPNSSPTVQGSDVGNFHIGYVDGSTADGYFVTDDLTLGGTTIYSAEVAVVTSISGILSSGIIGIGMDAEEAETTEYNGLLDDMVSQGLINRRAYSLYLDDLEAGTGDILFGAYDTSKYTGDLVALPIQSTTTLSVSWSSIALTDDSGTTVYNSDSIPRAATLDTGTSLTYVPSDIFAALSDYFSVSGGDVDCSWADSDGFLSYGFGDGAVTIEVPFSELVIDNGDGSCSFGIGSDDTYTLFGDTFLRSAYVLYDFDEFTISLAQASWDNSCSDCDAALPGK